MDTESATAGMVVATSAPPVEAASVKTRPRNFLGRAFVLYLPVLVLIAPLFAHQSKDAVLLGYSRDYLLILGALLIGGFGLCCALLGLFHKAPADRQLPFAFICMGLLAGGLLTAEWGLGWREGDAFQRYREWGHIRSPFYGFEAAANHSWIQAGVSYATDENTFRRHLAPRVDPAEEIRIVALGGSSVFGYGLHDDETWPHLLEGRLRSRLGPRITVINAGMNGHNTLQQLFRLYLRVLPERPHYVLHYGLINDVESENATLGINMPAKLVHASTMREYLRLQNAGKGFYLENSILANRLKDSIQRLAAGAREASTAPAAAQATEEDEGASRYIENLRTMELLCRDRGVRFIPATFLAELSAFPPHTEGRVRAYLQALRTFCRQSGTRLVDLYASGVVENGDALFFEDHYHPRPAGARYIADRMADALIPLLEAELTQPTRHPQTGGFGTPASRSCTPAGSRWAGRCRDCDRWPG